MNHFGGSVRVAVGAKESILELAEGSCSVNLTALVPLAILVGVMLLVGKYVRRMAPGDVRARLMTVLATAVTMAVVVGLVALLGGYTIASHELPGSSGVASGSEVGLTGSQLFLDRIGQRNSATSPSDSRVAPSATRASRVL